MYICNIIQIFQLYSFIYIFHPVDIQDNFLGFYNATQLFYMAHTSDTNSVRKLT